MSDQQSESHPHSKFTRRASQLKAASAFIVRLREMLSSITIDSLPNPTVSLISIHPHEKLKESFSKLLDHGILSAPVEKKEGGYEGFLDLRELVSAIVGIHQAQKEMIPDLEDYVNQLRDHPAMLPAILAGHDHLDTWTPSYMARICPIVSVPPQATLLDVCEHLGRGAHRVAVVEESGVIKQIISQSWMMDALCDLIEDMDSQIGISPVASISLETLGIAPKHVYSCKDTDVAIQAFRIMNSHKISGIPIVNSSGVLIGQVSGQDLKNFLKKRDTSDLDKQLKDFADLSQPISKFSVHQSSKVSEVITRFSDTKSHRLFLVDSNGLLIGVVSLKDILALLID
eukprot:c39_g1_i1.p1 GENE.c39_g1_i1~~c39_g1_i1.p1  ORF type:complete len:362 (+),score=148.97 c39_g1_i1:58-1086(+)